MDTSKMSKINLLEKCREMDIMGCISKNKSQLIELIRSTENFTNGKLVIETEY